MMVPRHDDLYSFKNLILPPLYLFDASGVIVPQEMILKEPACKPQRVDNFDETECSSAASSVAGCKRVSFKEDAEGKIVVVEYPGLDVLTPEEKEITWYRSSDFKYFKKYGKKLATIAAASKYGADFQKTLKACSKSNFKDLEKYSKIANSAARGLELLCAPELVKDRKGVVKSVLKAQSKMRDEMSFDERAEILCATSRILSRQTRILSRLLATGDANVAQTIHKE